MDSTLDELKAILELGSEAYIEHYGMPRRSGRYPWGSGEDPYQHSMDFLGKVEKLRKDGFTYTDEDGKKYTGDTAIAKSLNMSTTDFRTEIGLCKSEQRMYQVARANALKADGLNTSQIGKEMGVNESTVRSWFNEKADARMRAAMNTADFLRNRVDADGMIDVGRGLDKELRISKEKLDQALYILKREGYNVYGGRFPQPTNPGQLTTMKVLTKPDIEHKEIFELDKVKTANEYISRDNGETYEKKFNYPSSLDSKRMQIRYSEEGGLEKDGIVELRRGVKDLSLGESRYSQVRILVDNTHYIKGMAVYSDDMPDGVDVIFNTNKPKGTPMTKVLKEIKEDPDNPFGSAIKDADQGGQYWYDDDTGKRCSANDPNVKNKKLGLINKRSDEGDWSDWSDTLPSQFLSKQSKNLAQKQLDIAKADKLAEFEEICTLNNPTIKKHFLQKYADSCDAAAVDLKAAALPGQKYHVIIPVNSLKDDEIYAPRYENGTKLALVRYPHGGTFEIPILKVNNKHAPAKKLLGEDVSDAVGINKNVADRLSGADFDGDTVMCIPTHDSKGRVKITSTPYIDSLIGFDPKTEYGPETYKGRNVRLMTKKGTQTEMGKISNLITDMTLLGAEPEELARAVKHSMVVIDAHKHGLDYKQSEVDNNIAALHKLYQGKATGGASTIVSKASGQKSVNKRQGSPRINQKGKEWYDPSRPEGSLIWFDSDNLTYDIKKTNPRTGEVTTVTKKRTQKSTKMAETDDAYDLVSEARHPMELLYADYANTMKSYANKARMAMINTPKLETSESAKKTYAAEIVSLNKKLNDAELNTVRERTANRMAAAEVQSKKKAYKEEHGEKMDNSDVKKLSQQAVNKYRQEVGSIARKDRNIKITDKEWEAIQAGAISDNKLQRILNNTDIDELRDRATPKTGKTISNVKINRIKNLKASGCTLNEIAEKMNLSTSAVSKYLKGA